MNILSQYLALLQLYKIINLCKYLGGLFFVQSPSTSAEPELTEEHEQSSSTSRHIQYDIFLSFRGEDTRTTFTDYLYRKLKKRYTVFRDEEGIQCGENIAPALEKAIQESRLSLVVLSKDYVSSTSCLNELETIMECRREGWHHVVPIFYHVDPHRVRHQEGRFAVSLDQHKKDKKKQNKVGPWKAALREIADLKGIHVVKGKKKEQDIILEIIEDIGEIIGLETKENPIPTPDLVGQGFERAKAKILSWMEKDEVVKIGVCGMGGVGKTTLMTHIYNQVLGSSSPICWIAVSQDFSIHRLQNLIAQSTQIDISKTDDVKMRAAKLNKELTKRQKLILILDDLWNHFDEKEVGIPLKQNGCKLIFTTRSRDVCKRMGCEDSTIKMEPLEEDEAWMLFSREMIMCDPNVEKEARLVASECAGLPLGIRTLARCMRGVHDPREWRTVLVELKNSRIRNDDMEPEVFSILRFSFERLKDSSLKECLLYCSLFPEDFEIGREHLIKLLIAEGIIKRRKYRQEEIDKGHTMLNELEKLCLLNDCKNYEGEECMKMHDLIRDMALQILKKNSSVMVQTGMQLEKLPDMDEWEEDLEKVSLMNTHFKKIICDDSPMFPMLSTLLLCYNRELTSIHVSFFQQVCALKVLDLSFTSIMELPDSISNLVRLTALLLKDCRELKHLPSVGMHKELTTLDVSNTRIEQVPDGMELLVKLRYLNMIGCSKLEEFPDGILSNLSHLQFFRLNLSSIVGEEEVGGLRRLKYLECGFPDIVSLNKYIIESQNHEELHNFRITVLGAPGTLRILRIFPDFLQESPNMVILYSCDISREFHKLPQGTAKLEVHECVFQTSLFPLENAAELRSIAITHCHGVECFVSSSSSSGSYGHLPEGLEELSIEYNRSLRDLIRMEGEVPPVLQSSYGNAFAHLKNITIEECPGMKKLFPPGLLPNLKNLETISVCSCAGMEEIIASEGGEDHLSNPSLPRLRFLHLIRLPRLKSICSGLLICKSLEEIEVDRCWMLNKIPVAPSLSSFRKMEVSSYQRYWWEKLQWDHPDVKSILGSRLLIRTEEWSGISSLD